MSAIKYLLLLAVMIQGIESYAQYVQITKEQLIALTPEWKGERFADGRPKIPDDLIRRAKNVAIDGRCLAAPNAITNSSRIPGDFGVGAGENHEKRETHETRKRSWISSGSVDLDLTLNPSCSCFSCFSWFPLPPFRFAG